MIMKYMFFSKGGIHGTVQILNKIEAAVTYYGCACRCRGEQFPPKSKKYLIIDATCKLQFYKMYI